MSRRSLPSEKKVWELAGDVVKRHGISDANQLLEEAATVLPDIEETFAADTRADKLRAIAVAVAYVFNKRLARAFKARTGEGALAGVFAYALASALRSAYPDAGFDADIIVEWLRAYTAYKGARALAPLHTSFGTAQHGDGSERKTRRDLAPIASASVSRAPGVPTEIDRFRIVRRLGAGTFGVVYEARDPGRKSSEHVAIKVMALLDRVQSTGMDSEQLVELSSQRYLSGHPNILPVHEVVRSSDGLHLILVMPLARSNLADAIAAASLTPESAARHVEQHLQWASDIVCGLEHMHRNGLLHRDIKPENVLIARDGTAQLADFGLVRAEAARVPSAYGRAPNEVGTLAFQAPELLMDDYDYDAGVDWWAFGWVLFELLFGAMPIRDLPGDATQTSISRYLYENVGWPQRFRKHISHSFLQRQHTTKLSDAQRAMRDSQDERLRWPAVPQTSDENMLRHLLGDRAYARWLTAYDAIAQSGAARDDSGREHKHRIHSTASSVWKNARRALRGLLAIDPQARTVEDARQLLGGYPCRAPAPKGPASVASRNSFRDLNALVGDYEPAMALATQIWSNLNDQTPPGQTKPESLPAAARRLWRLAALSLAAKDLEATYPQLLTSITEQERRDINHIEPLLFKLVHEDIWKGFYRFQPTRPVPKPATSTASSSSSVSAPPPLSSPSPVSPRRKSPSHKKPASPQRSRSPEVAPSRTQPSLEATRSRPVTRSQARARS